MHIENGNIKQMLFLSWNKANSIMTNRIDTVRHIILEHSPDVFSIQETNIKKTDDLSDFKIPGYDLILDKMIEKHGLARTCIYISEKIRYMRRDEMESESEPMIALTIYPVRSPPLQFH